MRKSYHEFYFLSFELTNLYDYRLEIFRQGFCREFVFVKNGCLCRSHLLLVDQPFLRAFDGKFRSAIAPPVFK